MSKTLFYAIAGIALLSAGVWAYATNTDNPWPSENQAKAEKAGSCSASSEMAAAPSCCPFTAPARQASMKACPATQTQEAKQHVAFRAAWASLPFGYAALDEGKRCDWASKSQCDYGNAVNAKQAKAQGQCSLSATQAKNESQCSLTKAKQAKSTAQCSLKEASWAKDESQCFLTEAKQAKNSSQCSLDKAANIKQAKDTAQCSLEAKQAKSDCCPATCDSGKAKEAVERKPANDTPETKTAEGDEPESGDELAKANK